jgi:hypothetical protein
MAGERRRKGRTFLMKADGPTRTEPIGAPRPLLMHNETESKGSQRFERVSGRWSIEAEPWLDWEAAAATFQIRALMMRKSTSRRTIRTLQEKGEFRQKGRRERTHRDA